MDKALETIQELREENHKLKLKILDLDLYRILWKLGFVMTSGYLIGLLISYYANH